MDPGNSKSGKSQASFVGNDDASRNQYIIPQTFMSVTALNEAASYIAETTSFLARCFPDFSAAAQPVSRGSDGQEMVTFASGEAREFLDISDVSSSTSTCAVSSSSGKETDAPPIPDVITRGSTGELLTNDSALIQSAPTSQNGISIFQGHTPIMHKRFFFGRACIGRNIFSG